MYDFKMKLGGVRSTIFAHKMDFVFETFTGIKTYNLDLNEFGDRQVKHTLRHW